MHAVITNKFSAILGSRLLKLSKVAHDTGISRTTLTNLYYRRTTQVSLQVIDTLCRYLGCSVGDIFEFVEDEGKESQH